MRFDPSKIARFDPSKSVAQVIVSFTEFMFSSDCLGLRGFYRFVSCPLPRVVDVDVLIWIPIQ